MEEVQFVLNFSVDPHFCAIFDKNNNFIAKHSWKDPKRDGEETFSFLSAQKIFERNVIFCGGVSGPGGFSSLRVGAVILNAFAQKWGLPLHAVRADFWIEEFLKEKDISAEIVLNSFGDGVFIRLKKDLLRLSAQDAKEKLSGKNVFIEALPAEKKSFFSPLSIPFLEPEKSLLRSLQKSPPNTSFLPDYEFPPV